MKSFVIITALVRYKEKFLIGRRVKSKEFSGGEWEFISGFVEEKKDINETILLELKEETGLIGEIIKHGDPFIINEDAEWIVIPFLIDALDRKFKLNKKDHSELKWMDFEDIERIKELKDLIKGFKLRGLI